MGGIYRKRSLPKRSKGGYDARLLLSTLTHTMVRTIDLDVLIEQLLNTLTKEMDISKAAFLIVDNHKIIQSKGVGWRDHVFLSPRLESLLHGAKTKDRILANELQKGSLKDLFKRLDILIAMPMWVEDKEVSILILGPKRSHKEYSLKDIDLLDTFARQAGIAIQHASIYHQLKQLNEELEKRVSQRTRQLENVKKRELAKAKELSRLKDEFFFIAVHELRNPVTIIRGFLTLLNESLPLIPEDTKKKLHAIAEASDILNQLINDLVEIARSEAGRLNISLMSVDIGVIINSVIENLRSLALKRHVKIELNIPSPLPLVMADEKKVEEIVFNLLSNAIKYNRKGGKVSVKAFPKGNEVITEFQDTGYGIPKEKQGNLFKKFFRAHVKETQETMGTGLGLFISRMLVEKMNGTITFRSREGKGSTFAFSLPCAKA